jgi:RNA ligase (TIGR02306 family)
MKLASLEKILDIQPIPGADNILVATVLGYKTVVKKGEFEIGDFCVWHNPDCVVDETNPVYSFLKDKRLRVIKLRGQVSQGLALPISILNNKPAKDPSGYLGNSWEMTDPKAPARSFGNLGVDTVDEGWDVTEDVKIKKYEKPIPAQLQGKIKGGLPSFLIRTDEENLRSNPKVLEELWGKNYYITMKIDGSSGTFYWKDGMLGVCSRNLEILEDETNTFWRIAKQYNLTEKFKQLEGDWAIQGEVYGEGIQGNKLGIKGVAFAAFNLFNIKEHKYADYGTFLKTCFQLEIPTVPLIENGTEFELGLGDLIKTANELKYPNGEPAEGIVIRPFFDIESKVLGKRLSVKVISETFALKHKE